MEKDSSPLDTLRQLKEWLDAGTITPQEFETLKKKLLFNDAAPSAPVLPEPAATPEVTVPLPLLPEPLPPPEAPYGGPTAASRPTITSSTEPDEVVLPPDYSRLSDEEEETPALPAKSNSLATILIVGGVLALLALIIYLSVGNRSSERLTSVSKTDADTVVVQPEVGPQAEPLELPPVAAPETVRVAPALPPTALPADSLTPAVAPAPVTETPAPAPAPAPTDESAVRARVQQALTSYYTDLKAAPFNAAQHFAPTVERFYTLQNTTPAAISEDLTKSHFPEFTEEDTQVVPGSLKIGPETDDGTRMVTYQEKSRAFRVSRQQHQQTTAQVRVRFNKDYQIVYLRQERLLENTFTE